MFTLEEARLTVQNKPEFSINEREFGFCIDYHVSFAGSFTGPTARDTLILKNLRGTCFDKSGRVISLGFDKFHNLNECDGWREHEIDFTQPHTVLEKRDGSMVRAIPIPDGSYRLGTRAGITEVSVKAENFLKTLSPQMQQNYDDFIKFCLDETSGAMIITPIFEYCSRDQQIVITYTEPQLVLTAMRNTVTGEYATYDELVAHAKAYELPVIQPLLNESASMSDIAAAVRPMIGQEGVVVAFDTGFRVKIKADNYVFLHRLKDRIASDKRIFEVVYLREQQEVLTYFPELEMQFDQIESTIRRVAKMITEKFNAVPSGVSQKQFAEIVSIYPYRAILFSMRNKGKSADEIIRSLSFSTFYDFIKSSTP